MAKDRPSPTIFDDILTMAEAAQMTGLAAHTLTQQAEKGKLRARKIGHTWITTKDWLDEYVASYSRRVNRDRRP